MVNYTNSFGILVHEENKNVALKFLQTFPSADGEEQSEEVASIVMDSNMVEELVKALQDVLQGNLK